MERNIQIEGIMWFEPDKKKPLQTILDEGSRIAKIRIGIDVKHVYVNSHQYPDERKVGELFLIPVTHVMPDFYWMCK